jgi:hypothetical protein
MVLSVGVMLLRLNEKKPGTAGAGVDDRQIQFLTALSFFQ